MLPVTVPSALTTAVSNVEWGLEAAYVRLGCSRACRINPFARLISRFFLHLRSVYNDRPSTEQSQTTVPGFQLRTNPFWRRGNRVTTGFSVVLEAGTSTPSRFDNKNEGDIPQAEIVDVEAAIELQTRSEKDQDDVESVGDITLAAVR